MKKDNKNQSQQGDCIFKRIDKLPPGEKKVVAKGRIVVAHGESGHSHVIEDDDAELIQIGDRMILSLANPVELKHEEHHVHKYAPGLYQFGKVQEYDYFTRMARPVAD